MKRTYERFEVEATQKKNLTKQKNGNENVASAVILIVRRNAGNVIEPSIYGFDRSTTRKIPFVLENVNSVEIV